MRLGKIKLRQDFSRDYQGMTFECPRARMMLPLRRIIFFCLSVLSVLRPQRPLC